MNLRRGLIGLFSLLFFASAISMVTLVFDDSKDVSSRASVGVITVIKQNPLENQLTASTSAHFEKILTDTSTLSIDYDSSLWQSPNPQDKAPIFVLLKDLTTVKILSSLEMNLNRSYSYIDGNYVLIKKGLTTKNVNGWQTLTSQYSFFGQEKYLTYWQKNELFIISIQSSPLPDSDLLNLISGIKTVSLKVKGTTSTLDSSARLATLSRPSVVMILTELCSQIKTISLPGMTLSDKTYPFCAISTGTGFFVTPDGHVATNGHVVQMDTKTSLLNAILRGELKELLADYLRDLQSQQGSPLTSIQVSEKLAQLSANKDSLVQLTGALLQMNQNNFFNFTAPKYQYFVQIGTEPLVKYKDKNLQTSKGILSARLVGSDYAPINTNSGFQSSDVALLKVEGQNYPALPLGSLDDVTIGSELTLIGFPSVAGVGNSQILDYSAVTEPTITRGVVSAFKKAKGDQRTLIQTDASINQGNSGSPAVNQDGRVIGIATYGLTPTEGTGNFNLLRSVEDLKSLLETNQLKPSTGPTYDHWKTALDNYWLAYYKFAQSDFKEVKNLDPLHPTVDLYLTKVNQKANTTDDHSPLFNRQERRLYMIISGATMLVSIFMILILSLTKKSQINHFSQAQVVN